MSQGSGQAHNADDCIVIRSDGQFLGHAAHWHAHPDSALTFPNARIAHRALTVAQRCEPGAVGAVITVEDFEAGRVQLSVSASEAA